MVQGNLRKVFPVHIDENGFMVEMKIRILRSDVECIENGLDSYPPLVIVLIKLLGKPMETVLIGYSFW